MYLFRDENAAADYAKQIIADLLCNRVDISKLIISKELTKQDKVGIPCVLFEFLLNFE